MGKRKFLNLDANDIFALCSCSYKAHVIITMILADCS